MIVSRQNALVKLVKSLSDKKNRDALSLYVAEGVKTVEDAIEKSQRIETLICSEKRYPLLPQKFFTAAAKTEVFSNELFEYVSGETTPQGVIALITKPAPALPKNSYSVFLDGVSDPANVGAIIRTAAAAGYNDVFITSDCADAFGPKAVRASMGGIFRVNVITGEREKLLDKVFVPLVVADMGGENVFLTDIPSPICLAIGNEGNGVSERVKSRANKTVAIPMGNGMESLNAAVSAGILMYNLKKDF